MTIIRFKYLIRIFKKNVKRSLNQSDRKCINEFIKTEEKKFNCEKPCQRYRMIWKKTNQWRWNNPLILFFILLPSSSWLSVFQRLHWLRHNCLVSAQIRQTMFFFLQFYYSYLNFDLVFARRINSNII